MYLFLHLSSHLQVLELQSRLEAAQHRERAAQAEAERLR